MILGGFKALDHMVGMLKGYDLVEDSLRHFGEAGQLSRCLSAGGQISSPTHP